MFLLSRILDYLSYTLGAYSLLYIAYRMYFAGWYFYQEIGLALVLLVVSFALGFISEKIKPKRPQLRDGRAIPQKL